MLDSFINWRTSNRVFENKSTEERMNLIKLHKACCLCLELWNDADKCTILFRCSIPGCKGKNPFLHDAILAGSTNHSDNNPSDDGSTIPPTQKIWISVRKYEKRHNAAVLWDGGSTLSFITFHKAKWICLHGQPTNLEVTTVNDTKCLNSMGYKVRMIDKHKNLVEIEAYGIERISTATSVIVSVTQTYLQGFWCRFLYYPETEWSWNWYVNWHAVCSISFCQNWSKGAPSATWELIRSQNAHVCTWVYPTNSQDI